MAKTDLQAESVCANPSFQLTPFPLSRMRDGSRLESYFRSLGHSISSRAEYADKPDALEVLADTETRRRKAIAELTDGWSDEFRQLCEDYVVARMAEIAALTQPEPPRPQAEIIKVKFKRRSRKRKG